MKTYIINEKTNKVTAFGSKAAALKAKSKTTKYLCGLISEAADLSDFSSTELVSIHNKNGGHPLKRFSSKGVAMDRTMSVINKIDESEDPTESAVGTKTITPMFRGGLHESSMRGRCYDVIRDGMTIEEYVEKVSEIGYTRGQAMGALNKMAAVDQKIVAVRING